MPDPKPKTGRLTVAMPLKSDVRPTVNVIDAKTFKLVRTAFPDEEVVLPPGEYVISSTFPSGERALAVAKVRAGKKEDVALAAAASPPAADAGPMPPAPAPAPMLETLGPSAAEPGERPAGDAPTAVPVPFSFRYVGLSAEGVQTVEATTEVVGSGSDGVELLVHPKSYRGVVFIQLAMAGQVPLNVALPANEMTESPSCRVTVTTKPLGASVSLPDNPVADAVARYMFSGNFKEAGKIAVEAEQLLRAKMGDPVAAALGGYALLRLHELTRLHEWPANLAEWFPWLPDGPIIAGEAAALRAQPARAVDYFCEAARRGLPIFADGFSMLLSRLREYSQENNNAPPGVAPRLLGELAVHAKRLLPLGPLIDFSRISLAVHGVRLDNPLASQTPISEAPRADGWRQFSPATQSIED